MADLTPITREEKIIAGEDVKPVTRREKFLKAFGGGGGVLTVGMVNTSLSTEVYEMDKTFEEIAAAIEARQGVQLIYDFEKKYPSVFMLCDFTRQSYGGAITSVMFSKVLYLESGMVFEGWSIASDGTIQHFRSDGES